MNKAPEARRKRRQKGLPSSFRPLLWSYRWEAIDPERDRSEIILSTVNHGTLAQWRWLTDYYDQRTIRRELEQRLVTEIYPESRHLARLYFGLEKMRDAR